MFRTRIDHISGLIDLHQRLESSNISCLLENPASIIEDVEAIREFLRIEIESFATYIIEGSLNIKKIMDIQFAEKVIEFNPKFFGKLLEEVITKSYFEIGFDTFLKFIAEIKNLNSAIDGIEALFKKIIVDGEKHRTEAHELTMKLEDITSGEDFNTLSADQMLRVSNMIVRLKPHARPVVKKMFYFNGMPLKEGEENGSSYPIFSQTGNWSEHTLVMSAITNSFEETQNKFKKKLKK